MIAIAPQLQTAPNQQCPRCHCDATVKVGKYCGYQRFRCQGCRKTFKEEESFQTKPVSAEALRWNMTNQVEPVTGFVAEYDRCMTQVAAVLNLSVPEAYSQFAEYRKQHATDWRSCLVSFWVEH